MLVAVCDQNEGNSTSFCSNEGPSLPGISAVRCSQSTVSKGSSPSLVKYRSTPMDTPSLPSTTRVSAGFSVVAIRLSSVRVLIRILADLGSLPNTCSPEIFHPGQLLLELLNILKIAVDRGKSHVRHGVEPAQRRQRLLADRLRRHLLTDAVSQPRLDGRR